jgi:anti-sigma regulatory factor (Ser/Thr protein kinase)
LERVPFSPGAVAAEVSEILGTQARAKGLSLDVRAESGIPASMEGDPLRFRQVLMNLVGNAIKFTHRGSVVLFLGADARRGRLRVSVEDTGIGIARETLPRLFEKFTQADTSTTRKFGGSGLGLAITRELVELMGGRLEVESEEGRGSMFFFDLPVDEAAATRDAPEADLKRMKVLVVGTGAHTTGWIEALRRWNAQGEACPGPADAVGRIEAAWSQGAPYAALVLEDGSGWEGPAQPMTVVRLPRGAEDMDLLEALVAGAPRQA